MFQPDDTIVAIATPPGRGGIGVVRLSGPDAARIAAAVASRETQLEPRRATLARVRGRGGIADQTVLTYFPAPHSYTAEDSPERHLRQVLYWKVIYIADNSGSDRHRRRPCGSGGGVGGGAHGTFGRDLHAVGCDRRAHAVQSGRRWDRQGAPRPRDRRARRFDGPRDRRDGNPVQAAQSKPRSSCARTSINRRSSTVRLRGLVRGTARRSKTR